MISEMVQNDLNQAKKEKHLIEHGFID